MKMKKWGVFAAVAMLVVALGLVGCSSGSSSSSSASSSAASSSSSAASAGDLGVMQDGTLTIATSPDYPPFENLEDGEYVGFDIDFARELATRLGLEAEFKTLQFDGIVAAIAAGGQADVGISGITVDPERAELVDFSESYYIDDQAIAVMKDSGITADDVDTALAEPGMIIAVQSGSTGETFARENYPEATIQPYGNATDCFAAMQSGNANAVCMNRAVVLKMVESAYTDAEVVKSVATGEEYAVAISQDNPELLKAINEAIADMQADGTIDTLNQKYFG